MEAGLLGYLLGEMLREGEIAYIDTGAARLSKRSVIELCAAGAASGSIAHCVVKGVSPEDQGPPPEPRERITIGVEELRAAREEVEEAEPREAPVFFTGCPHLSPSEALEAARAALESGRTVPGRREVWIALPGYATLDARLQYLARKAAVRGVRLLFGTCPVVADVKRVASTVATDSLKTAFYLSRRGVRVALATLREYLYAGD